MSFDNVCKLIAEKYPQEFANWLLTEEPGTATILKTELSIEPIRADFVVFLQTETRILHIEFQTLPKSEVAIPLRMLDYYTRLTRIYKVPVTQVVIFLQETSDERVFINEYVGENTNHRYRVIRMWEQNPALFLNNPALLPLAPLAHTDSPENLLSQIAENIAKIADREIQQDIATYTEILAGLRFEKNLIYQWLKEEIMQESVIYQDIVQKSEQRGELRAIIRQLNRRFGEIDLLLVNRIKSLPIEKLDDLAEALLDFFQVADLVTWLNQYGN